ncbi:MAG: DotA/TraY family protein [Bdellovibrionales bacterium]
MSGIQAKKVAGYVILPGIMPRVGNLFTSGFGYIAFLIAQIYAMVRLLPSNHPYLNPENIGKFNVRQVIAEAANHIVLKKENIDQILIFGVILTGLVLIIIQIAMIIFALIFEPALASYPSAPHPSGTVAGKSIFLTVDPTFDIAFMLLDQVFGIPDMFGSCIEQGVSCQTGTTTIAPTPLPAITPGTRWPFHQALHELFRFYNTGILLIGALIFLYFILIVIGETAVTGTPFGQRFQNVWVPIRLVVALGLLVPINYGLNSGQFITLFAAKIGSGFATNTWVTYNNQIRLGAPFAGGKGANPTGERTSLIGNPEAPDVTPILTAMSVVHSCAAGFYYIDTDDAGTKQYTPDNDLVKAYFFKTAPNWMPNTDSVMEINSGTTYADALSFFNNSDITIRFGEHFDNDGDGEVDAGETELDHCGEIRISIHSASGTGLGPEAVQEYYYTLIRDAWFDANSFGLEAFAFRFASLQLQGATNDPALIHVCNPPSGVTATDVAGGVLGALSTPPVPLCNLAPRTRWQTTYVAQMQTNLQARLGTIWTDYTNATNLYEMNSDILSRGWAGAGIWYNTIARINGNYMSAVRDVPVLSKYPIVMRNIQEIERRENVLITQSNRFCLESVKNTGEITSDMRSVGEVLCKVMKYWNDNGRSILSDEVEISGSVFEDTINLIFGTQPLSAMTDTNVSTHPLTQLTLLGKGLVDASIRNIATASAGSAIGGLGVIIDRVIPGLITPAADFILSTAFVGLTAGLVLYYIVPFLPFIYFFFAVASWIKTIFEAMVGAPLWALAHLRIDGDGLPGTSALNGYFLIFEIFLRPVLTIFGLVAATLIFTAQVRVLHFLWSIVTENLAGFDNDTTIDLVQAGNARISFKRSIVDQFFFSVIYAIIVYMMAIAAFKLIDKIPDNLLRWMGNQVSSFGDINQDSVDGLTRYAALGGATAGRQLSEGVQQAASGAGGSFGNLLARATGAGR